MAGPFRRAPAKGGLSRALRSKRTIAFEAIENLLAESDSARGVSREAVSALCDPHGIDLKRGYLSDRKDLYRRYLSYCLDDKVLNEGESAELTHLRLLLYLEEDDVSTVHDEVARDVYGKAIREVLSDLEIDADEEAFLRRLQSELNVSDEQAAQLLESGQRYARQLALSQASPAQEKFSMFRAAIGEFIGRSDDSLEAAVGDAIKTAQIASPNIRWFEVTEIAGHVGEGKPKDWRVTVRCGIFTA